MKRKVLVFCIGMISLLLVGCGKHGEKDVLKTLSNNIEKSKGYYLTGVLEIINNEDSYLYDVDVSYKEEDKFRVSLKNQTNSHEQIILKNEEGVYVLTPSLNKSFKFQSEWPYNNSQSYLLQTILNDIKNDKKRTFSETKDGYLFTTSVNYLSNKDLIKQNIYLDKNLKITQVHVLNNDNQVKIKMTFDKIDMKKSFDDEYFSLSENMSLTENNTVESVSKIDNIIYPMYMPVNTYLADQETIKLDNGERAILTFSGDKSFMLVQETLSIPTNYQVEDVLGDPCVLADTVGIVNDYSVNWQSNGIDYYLMSNDLEKEELVSIALSVSAQPVSSIIK